MMHVMKHKTISLAAAAALALGSAGAAHAEIGFKAGAWDLSFSGNVNGFATWNTCDNTANVVAGGLACSKPLNGGVNEQRIESGLLPSALVFSAKSRQMNLDIGVTIGFYPGLNGIFAGGKTGLDTSGIDLRQNFLTFGDKGWGTVKVGKDIGLFGSDAILADMTLLGVGSGAAFLGGNTTLGRIGVGYIYTDWIPQITYSSRSYGGFSFAGGVFQGVNIVSFSGLPSSATVTGHEEPGFQGKASYEWKGAVSGKAWVSGIAQKVKSRSGDAAGLGPSVSGNGFDIGAKVNWGALEGVVYAYSADGIGTTAIGFDAASFAGGTLQKRKSDGWYAQATYKIGAFKPGVSYGESNLKLAGNESSATNPTLVKTNKSWVFGLYYSLTPSVNLVAEYIPTEAENQAGGTVKDKVMALGAILFF
jgi:predicted porin